jgi:hypothetical protein
MLSADTSLRACQNSKTSNLHRETAIERKSHTTKDLISVTSKAHVPFAKTVSAVWIRATKRLPNSRGFLTAKSPKLLKKKLRSSASQGSDPKTKQGLFFG